MEINRPVVCRGGTTAGRYHTHGANGNQGPSGPDIVNANNLPGVPFHVETPCGSIVKFTGPNAAANQETIRMCIY